jgi:uncharacterized repeat protein (TIGR04076 family)
MANKYRVVCEVTKLNGDCPIYEVGDKIVVDPIDSDPVMSAINPERSAPVCTRILGTPFMSYCLLFQARTEEEMAHEGLTQRGSYYFKCPEPGPPYTRRGWVQFKLYREAV